MRGRVAARLKDHIFAGHAQASSYRRNGLGPLSAPLPGGWRRAGARAGDGPLDASAGETRVHYDVEAFRTNLDLRGRPVALDWRAVRALWVDHNDDPVEAQDAFDRLLVHW
jgi:hypothetical protein